MWLQSDQFTCFEIRRFKVKGQRNFGIMRFFQQLRIGTVYRPVSSQQGGLWASGASSLTNKITVCSIPTN